MQRYCTPDNITATAGIGGQSHGPNFSKVHNARKQPIRALWVRNGRYYAQLKVDDPQTGRKRTRRILLLDKEANPVQTDVEAVAALERLKTQRRDDDLPMLRQNPKLVDYVKSYFQFFESGQGGKQPSTLAKEKSILNKWTTQLGELRLGQIKRHHVNTFLESRLKSGKSARTVNLDVIALRNVLKRAREEQRISRLPTDGMRAFKTTTVKRPFFNTADLHKLCQAAFLTKRNEQGEDVAVTKNAQEFVDYVRLLAYCGARRNEALALRWQDVDFEAEQLTIGALGDTKNRTPRVVDFNRKLRIHLLDMRRRRAPDCQWLFPSPQRGSRDVSVKTFQESLRLVRERAGLPGFQFHDCRHHFISMCVMSGIDFMTIAAWAGHRDGGVLIGKVYGHLANEHRKRMASQVVFEPAVVQTPAVA